MRNQLLVSTALLVLAACASPTSAPDVAPPAPKSATRVIQIHDVRDIVSPPGDPQGASHLADQVREMVVFIHGGEDPGATVAAHGTAIVVVAAPEMQRRVSDYLLRQRESVKPDGL